VEDRGAWLHCDQRVEDRGQKLRNPLELQRQAAFCSGLRFPATTATTRWPTKRMTPIENIGVVRIDEVILMQGGAEKATRNILPGKILTTPGMARPPFDVNPAGRVRGREANAELSSAGGSPSPHPSCNGPFP